METTAVEVKIEETDKKINDICSMSWLKRSPQLPVEVKSGLEMKQIMPKTQNMEDYVAGTKPVKRRKQKRSKSNTASSSESVKDVKSKNSDTDTENSGKQDKQDPKVPSVTNITVISSTTVWNTKANAAAALFPEAQSKSVQIADEDAMLSSALEESIITAQLEKFRLTNENKVNWADDSEDAGWGSAHHYQLETSDDKDKDTEKIERKTHDGNNNNENKSTISKEQESKEIDKYGRVGGYTERHLFMGRGARMKEQQMLGNQNNRGCFNRRPLNSMSEKSDCEHFQKINMYDNRNKGHRDYVDNRCNFDNKNDDRREFRNRNYQTFNQRGRFENYQHRFDNQNHPHRQDNYPQKYDNQPQRHDNQHQRYDNQHQRYDNQHQRYDNRHQRNDNRHQRNDNQPQRNYNQHQQYNTQYQRYDNQQRRFENNRFGNNQCRDFSNKDQKQNATFPKGEFRDKDLNKFDDNKEQPVDESKKNNTPEIQQSPEKEKEDQLQEPETKPEVKVEITPEVKPDQENIEKVTRASTPIVEDSSSLCFIQESSNEEESGKNTVENIDCECETTSEQSEYQETPVVSTNPFNVRPVPVQVIHPSGVVCQSPQGVPIHNGIFPSQSMPTFNKLPSAGTYSMITNPFIAPAPNLQHFQHQHTHEIPPEGGCTAVPIQNMDMRFFHQHPLVHNHHPFMPITLPVGMPSCGHLPQMPVGSIPGINFMHQQSVNCQQCPPHLCQSQRIPIQSLNCQSSVYPQFTNVMTPMGPVFMPITPASQGQILPQPAQNPQQGKNFQANKVEKTPATIIERSANKLVNLCEALPSRRGNYSANCPPGFESNASSATSNSNPKKIICDKQQDTLPSFRNNPREYDQEKMRKSSKKTEEFTDEKLADIYNEINTNSKNVDKEDEKIPIKWPETSIKFRQDSYHEQLLRSYMNSDDSLLKSDSINTPRPGFRVGLGRGKRLGRTD